MRFDSVRLDRPGLKEGAVVGFYAPNLEFVGKESFFKAEIATQNSEVFLVATGSYEGSVSLDAPESEATNYTGSISGTNMRVEAAGGDGRIFIIGGQITLESGVDIEGYDGAAVVVTAQDIEMSEGAVLAITERPGDVPESEPTDGGVTVNASTIALSSGARIVSTTRSEQLRARPVTIVGNSLDIVGDGTSITGIQSETGFQGGADAGPIVIDVTGNLSIVNGSNVRSQTFGEGDGGDVDVSANNIVIDGTDRLPEDNNRLETGINASSSGFGAAGQLTLTAGNLTLLDSGVVGASDISGVASAGAVLVSVTETIYLDGVDPKSVFKTGIVSDSSNSSQPGGSVSVSAQSISITNGALVSAISASEADSGNITVSAENMVIQSGGTISGEAVRDGVGGEVDVAIGGVLTMSGRSDTAPITGITTTAENNSAGPITVNAGLTVINNSLITTSTAGVEADGGSIATSGGPLVLNGGFIQANATSGSGGTITVDNSLVIPSGNRLLANTASQSGAIAPTPGQVSFQVNGPNVIQAEAEDGVSIDPVINAPQFDISGALSDLDSDLLDRADVVDDPCAEFGDGTYSTLVQLGRGGIPAAGVSGEAHTITVLIDSSLDVGFFEVVASADPQLADSGCSSG